MPQDKLRSRIYKSFLTCNDPKGIVDSSTVRKQKVGSSEMEKRIKSRRTRKNSYELLDCKLQREKTVIKGIGDEFDSSSSFQLTEVSRGAQKLNRAIDLWSNGMKNGRQSEQIARDLFEGARDLQESLVILGKLQEASWYMTQVKKKEQTQKRTGNIDMEKTCFNRFEFQKPRLSADYSYGKGAEELKNVIRDRLAKQIMFPNITIAEKTCFHESNMENSASEIASSSSSQSSMIYNTAANPEKKGYGKNLIAKLMGLEPQSQELQETLHKQLLGEKVSDQQRRKFCMEMAEAKKPESVTDKIAKRNSKANLDTKQFKGILKQSAKEMNLYFNHSSYTHSRDALTHTQPIVLLKPQHVSQVELEACQTQAVEEDGALNVKEFTKLKMKEKYPQETNDIKIEALSSKKVFGSIGAEETTLTRINHRKEDQNPEEENWKPKECVSVIKSKPSSHIPQNQNLQRKEAIDEKVLESQIAVVTRKNLLQQANIVPKFQDQVQGPPRKLHIKPNVMEELIPQESMPTPNTVSEWTSLKKNQAIREKVINEVTVVKSMDTNLGGQNNDKKPGRANSPASLLYMKEKAGDSNPQICDFCSKSQSSLIHLSSRPESSKCEDHGTTVNKTGTNLQAPTSSSRPSANHTEELFHLKANGTSRIWISPNEPTPNVCDGMDSPGNYRKIKGMKSGIFGLGWRALESVNEAEEVVEDLEKEILVGLIREVFT